VFPGRRKENLNWRHFGGFHFWCKLKKKKTQNNSVLVARYWYVMQRYENTHQEAVNMDFVKVYQYALVGLTLIVV